MVNNLEFKAWDKSTNQMFDVGEIHFCHGGIRAYGTGVHIGNGWVTQRNGCKHECDVVLRQYIGVEDSKGVKIFEDDVVKIKHEDDGGEYSFGKVSKFNSFYPAFDVYVKSNRSASGFESYHDEYNSFSCPDLIIEVIGNIYENPELLDEC